MQLRAAARDVRSSARLRVGRSSGTEFPGAIAVYFVIARMMAGLLTLSFGWVMPDRSALVLWY